MPGGKSMSGLAYRRDIDGLRALAILPVVLYHFGLGGITGGYVGVDVFLVISGYLITSIISREQQVGRYRPADLGQRRRRDRHLLPLPGPDVRRATVADQLGRQSFRGLESAVA
ncbi:acyltransferase [Pseudomonas paraeruginosa]